MKAAVLDRFGDPDVLRIGEVERPRPGGGEVLVRVVASGTNPVDAKIRQAGEWAQIELPAVIGYDASGTVEEVGPGVTDLAPGDEVIVVTADNVALRFVVRDAAFFRPEEAPLADIFGPADTPNLNLITCGGAFNPDTQSYDQRLIVFTTYAGR